MVATIGAHVGEYRAQSHDHPVGDQQRVGGAALMAVAIMSSDGQDPISVIPEMLNRLYAGSEIVWGKRIDRKNDGFISRNLATVFYRFFGFKKNSKQFKTVKVYLY